MSEFDFTKPQPDETPPPAAPAAAPFKAASSPFYNAAVAESLFRKAGKQELFTPGQVLFTEDEKATKGGLFSSKSASRMYLLTEGEVGLYAGGRVLDSMKPGDVFGEMAVITGDSRSASAQAKTAGAAYSLNATELQSALEQTPEFALMLMSVMFDRLRFVAARLSTRKTALPAGVRESTVFDPALLAQFEAALPRAATVRHWGGASIMREGQTGAFMYLVKSGRVVISIRNKPVEYVNAGGTFGEMALVDQSARTASATAETEVVLLSIDRPSLLEAVKVKPVFAMAMLKAVAERLRFMNSQLV
jgi:CRP-like cAMP-binding protein